MKQRLIGNNTVMVTDLPPQIAADHKKCREYFDSLFPGEIIAIKIAPNVPGLMGLKDERFKHVTALEKAQAVLNKKGERPTTRTTLLVGKKVDAIDYHTEQIAQIDNLLYSNIAAGQDAPKKWKKLLNVKQDPTADPENLKQQMGMKRSKAINRHLPKSQVCFLIFKDANKASLAALASMSAMTGKFNSQWAPEPADVYWGELYIGSTSRAIRRVIIWFVVILTTFFNAIPITFITGLYNLGALSTASWANGFADPIINNSVASGIISGVIPSLLITIYFSLIPKFIHFLCNKEGHYSYSSVERSMLSKYFFFIVFNIFLVSLLGSGILGIINQFSYLAQNPTQIVTLLATSLPLQVPYFINYVLTAAVIAHFLFLIRPVDIILYELKKRILAKSARDFRGLLTPPNVWITPRITMDILIFLIVIVYSTIAPLILPFGLIFFIFAYVATKHNLLYVYEIPLESGADLWPNIFSRMMVGVMIYQLTLTGIFAIFLNIAGAVICGVLFLFTIAYTQIVHKIFDQKFEYGAMDDAFKSDITNTTVRLRKVDKQMVDYDHPITYNWEDPEPQVAAAAQLEEGRGAQPANVKLGKAGRDLLPLGETVGEAFNGTVAHDRSNSKFPADIAARMQAGRRRDEEKRIPHNKTTTDLPGSEDEGSVRG